MALGILLLFYVGISAVSIVGFLGLYLVKNERAKKVIFYIMSIWGIALAAVRAASLPVNWIGQRTFALGLGVLCIAALAVHIKAGKTRGKNAAYLLLTVSVAAQVLLTLV